MVAPPDSGGRDARGRFAPGNPGGPGGARRRAYELRRVAEEVITPDIYAGIMRKAARMALEGNLSAIRFVSERVAGRPAEVPLESQPLDVTLPSLKGPSACAEATDRVLQGICDGTIDRETARILIEGIQVRLKVIDAVDLENRLAAMEEMIKAVELPSRR